MILVLDGCGAVAVSPQMQRPTLITRASLRYQEAALAAVPRELTRAQIQHEFPEPHDFWRRRRINIGALEQKEDTDNYVGGPRSSTVTSVSHARHLPS